MDPRSLGPLRLALVAASAGRICLTRHYLTPNFAALNRRLTFQIIRDNFLILLHRPPRANERPKSSLLDATMAQVARYAQTHWGQLSLTLSLHKEKIKPSPICLASAPSYALDARQTVEGGLSSSPGSPESRFGWRQKKSNG